MRYDRNFNGGMQDKNISAGQDLLILRGSMRDSLKIDGGMRDEGRKTENHTLRTLGGELKLLKGWVGRD